MGLGRYGKTVTVLTCHSLANIIEEEEEGDDDESMIERWTPRFHHDITQPSDIADNRQFSGSPAHF